MQQTVCDREREERKRRRGRKAERCDAGSGIGLDCNIKYIKHNSRRTINDKGSKNFVGYEEIVR